MYKNLLLRRYWLSTGILIPLLTCVALIQANDTTQQITVFVSIPPQKYWLERIGGQRITVINMLPSKQSPETYEPTPRLLTSLAKANLYFCINLAIEENWIKLLQEEHPKLKIIGCQKHPRKDNNNDPHTDFEHSWTSPKRVLPLIKVMRQELAILDPSYEPYYTERYLQLKQEIIELDADITALLKPITGHSFIVNHPAWQAFANDYGLIQRAIEQHAGNTQIKTMIEIIKIAKHEGIRRIFFQKQFHYSTLQSIADELAAELIELDPLSEDYIHNLRLTAELIAGSFKTL